MTATMRAPSRRHTVGDSARPEDRPCHVVVAEDDSAMRALVGDALRGEGYEVSEVVDGDALRSILDAAFAGREPRGIDLIVTDNRMPRCSGLEVLELLRAHDWATPVILITAFGDAETHTEAQRLGVHTVLDKPFPLRALRRAVRELVPPSLGRPDC